MHIVYYTYVCVRMNKQHILYFFFLTVVLFEVVVFAEQCVVLLPRLEVESLSRGQLLAADGAGEATQVVDFVPGLADVVLREDPFAATSALGTETSKK